MDDRIPLFRSSSFTTIIKIDTFRNTQIIKLNPKCATAQPVPPAVSPQSLKMSSRKTFQLNFSHSEEVVARMR